jgi:hypothetical protein
MSERRSAVACCLQSGFTPSGFQPSGDPLYPPTTIAVKGGT